MTPNVTSRPQEAELLAPLDRWLRDRRLIRDDSLVVRELPLHGRRVDLAVLTRSGRTTAYELKLRDNRRALEQGALNGVSFDRSFVVTASRPSPTTLEQAGALGIGVLLVSLSLDSVTILQRATTRQVHPVARQRLRSAIKARSQEF